MHAFAIFQAELALSLATSRIQELTRDADSHRLAVAVAGSGRRSRIGRALAALQHAIVTPAETSASSLPSLNGYPYRS